MQIEYQMQRSARRSRSTKKRLNKRIVTLFIAVVLLVGATQAYAAGVLSSNIIDLIKNGIQLVTTSRVADVNTQSVTIETESTTSLQNAVTATKNAASNELAVYTESELKRAREELTAYLAEKQVQMNSALNPEVELSKQAIRNKVNAVIILIKGRLDEEFSRALTDAWKP